MCLKRLGLALFLLCAAADTIAQTSSAAPARQPQKAARPAGVNLSGAYNAYVNRLRGKVGPNWNFPEGKNHVVLSVQVEPDGTAGDVTLTSTPKSEPAEQAANAAFAQSQPLEALPAQSPPVKVTLTFDSSYDPHGDSNSSISARLDPIAQAKPQ